MNFNINHNDNKQYLDCTPFEGVLSTESDVMELISACFSNNTENLLLHEKSVSPDFFKLRTGLAGVVLNKFQIYNIKAAMVLDNLSLLEGRFGEMAVELNKGNDFRIYDNAEAATEWLTATCQEPVMRMG